MRYLSESVTYRHPRIRHLIRVLQVALILALLAYSIQSMVTGGVLIAREDLEFLPQGLHWFSIVIFLSVFLAYLVKDEMVNLVYVVPIGVVYYCLHEAIFNALFIPYNGFRDPVGVSQLWYQLLDIVFIVSVIFVALAIKYKDRFLRAASGGRWSRYVSIVSWVSLVALYGVRILYGFPVTIDVYDFATQGLTVNDPLASGFELATNFIFAFAFYSTFTFVFRKKTPTRSWARVRQR